MAAATAKKKKEVPMVAVTVSVVADKSEKITPVPESGPREIVTKDVRSLQINCPTAEWNERWAKAMEVLEKGYEQPKAAVKKPAPKKESTDSPKAD